MLYKEYASRFWEVHRYCCPSIHELSLYFYLLEIWDKNGRPDTFVCEPKQIEMAIGLSKQTLSKCRERLQDKGLIGHEKGNRRIKKPYYFLMPLTNTLTNTLTNEGNPVKVSPTPPSKDNIYNINHQQQLCARTHEKNLEDLKEVLMKSGQWLESVRLALFRNYKIAMTEDEIKEKLSDYFIHLQSEGIEAKTKQDAKSHFKNWIAKVHEIENKKQQHGASDNKIGGQHNVDPDAAREQLITIYREVYGYDGPPEKFEEWYNRRPFGS